MSDKPSIQIDSDWKRQAQEEKRKLAEEEAKKKAAAPAPASRSAATAAPRPRALPEPTFSTLVQQTMTQALYYLGELGDETEQPTVSFDMAKHHIDTLGVLETKTRGNLTPEEQSLLDQVLYDTRSRYVSIVRQTIA
ncbi:MAG TPA: DUF1844 domain-containing protein [Tepidisphaeraceae bacterium]|jgi:hypothetical protein